MKLADLIFWIAISLAILGTLAWNVSKRDQVQTEVTQSQTDNDRQWLRARMYELAQTGKFLDWPDSMRVFGDNPAPLLFEGYGLVLAINDLSCDTCRDEQTQFALDLERSTEKSILRTVVSAANPMYARSFMRLNGIKEPVFYDQNREFFERNSLGNGPLLLLHNPQGEVIAAHFPVTGRPEISQPFHQMARAFFGADTGQAEPLGSM